MSGGFYGNVCPRSSAWIKSSFLLSILLSLCLPVSSALAFNQEAKTLLQAFSGKRRAATEEELMEMLLPVAADQTLSHMQKVRDMSYLVHITGWDLSKAEKRDLFYRVDRLLETQRKEAYLQAHPDLDDQMQEAIKKSSVFIGMSMDQVKASLGKPEEIRPPFGTFMNSERWSYYSKRIVVFFKDGELISWKKLS